jgi:hypothetical protein
MHSGRMKALIVVAAILILGNGMVPVCGAMCCPLAPDVPLVHAQMPCCAPGASIGAGDVTRTQPATVAGSVSLPLAWNVVARLGGNDSPTLVAVARDTAAAATQEPSPPLFLLNAQFLI